MGTITEIAWTDHSWNCWRGCSKISQGCDFCYAEQMSTRNPAVLGEWGPDGTRVVAAESYWKLPHKWNRAAEAEGRRHRVFCLSLGDWLEDRPELIPVRARLLTTIAETPWLDWQLLTKRPEGWEDRIHEITYTEDKTAADLAWDWLLGTPPPNVWVGASTENQEMADLRIPLLLQIPAAVRFVSAEPLLGPVTILREWRGLGHRFAEQADGGPCCCGRPSAYHTGIDWLIVGGESGPNRRPVEIDWIASLVRQCSNAGIAAFVKQDGHARPGQQGRIPDELWIKEFPRV